MGNAEFRNGHWNNFNCELYPYILTQKQVDKQTKNSIAHTNN